MIKLPQFLEQPEPQVYLSNNYLVLDFETTNKNKGSALDLGNNLVLSVWKQAEGDFIHSWNNEFDLEELIKAVEAADFLVAHNAKFELQWLSRCGLDLSTVLVYDTMIGEYVRGGNRWKYGRLSLDSLAKKYGFGHKTSLVSKLIKQGVCPSEIPSKWLKTYCEQDVRLTERVFLAQREILHESNKLAIQYTRCLLTPVLADIESNGMQLDGAKVKKEYVEQAATAATLEMELNHFAGGISWSSPIQVAEFVYGKLGFDEVKNKRTGEPIRTSTGRKKADKVTLGLIKAKTAKQKRFLALYKAARHASTQVTKYLEKFNACCNDNAGVLNAYFQQCGTYTHRLSSAGAVYKTQFQNFPRSYKHLFRARNKGWLIGESDGSQLEFRVAIHIGRDEQGLKDILTPNFDVHAASAEIIGVSRQNAKEHTFKPLYGGSSGTTKEKEYYKYFKNRYYGVAQAQQSWIDKVLSTGSLITEWGMQYYWPDTKMDTSGYVSNTTSICNYPVQALATAEIIPVALVYFWHRAKRMKLKLFVVNTVHDSIIVELPPEEKEIFHELSRQSLIDDVYPYLKMVYNIDFTVPLGCETKVGEFWSVGESIKYEATKELYAPAVV